MAAREETSSHRSRREDRGTQDRRSYRSHRDERKDPTTSSSRSHDRRDREDTLRRRSRSPSITRSIGSEGEHELHPILTRHGVAELSEDDYFVRSAEFKAWLSESKGKYLDEIPSKDARRYFERFVRRWNEGKLPEEYYKGRVRSATAASGSSSQTRHRWAFTNKATYTPKEQEQLATIRDNVDVMTNSEARGAVEAREAERRARHGRSQGSSTNLEKDLEEEPRRDSGWGSRSEKEPSSSTSKSYADAQYDREHRQDLARIAQSDARHRARQDRAEEEEAVHGRATGRDRALEKKRERNAVNRDFANRRQADDGIEMDDRELYDQDSVPHAVSSNPRRSNGLSKREQARQERMEERKAEMQEKVSALKEKDAKTMEMFKAMAQQRFGGS